MSTAPEVPIRVTREMIEAHYKSVMNAARILLSQGETAHAQELLSEACRRPYPTPAPAVPKSETTQLCITPSPCSEEMSALYPEFSRGWNACLECVIEQLACASMPPAPASMPEAAGRETLVSWSTDEVELLEDYLHNWAPQTRREQTTSQTARLINAALNNLIAKSTGGRT